MARLQKNGLGDADIRMLDAEINNGKSLEEAAEKVSPGKRDAAVAGYRQALHESRAAYKGALGDIESWSSARLHNETLAWPSSGNLRISAEPYSVQLLVFKQ